MRQSRPAGDRLGAYLQARGQAGELWADIQDAGCAREPQRHPGYAAFTAAQERRHGAVRAVAGDPLALDALRRAGVISPQEFAADHLMATGTRTRAEAMARAEGRALELGLVEPPKPRAQQSVRGIERDYGPEM